MRAVRDDAARARRASLSQDEARPLWQSILMNPDLKVPAQSPMQPQDISNWTSGGMRGDSCLSAFAGKEYVAAMP